MGSTVQRTQNVVINKFSNKSCLHTIFVKFFGDLSKYISFILLLKCSSADLLDLFKNSMSYLTKLYVKSKSTIKQK